MRSLVVVLVVSVASVAFATQGARKPAGPRDARIEFIPQIISSSTALNELRRLAGHPTQQIPSAATLKAQLTRDAQLRWRAEVRKRGDRFQAWIVHANGLSDLEGTYLKRMEAVWAAGDYANVQNATNPRGRRDLVPGGGGHR